MTKIQTLDILAFREDIFSSRDLLRSSFEPVKCEIIHRYADVEKRMQNTVDIKTLQRLDSFRKFLRTISEQFDLQWQYIDRISEGFVGIDDLYWKTVLNGQKLADENDFLRASLASAIRREELIMDGWRADRQKFTLKRTA